MNVFRDIADIQEDVNSIITVGTFDGVHIGHVSIINKLLAEARKANARDLLITFEPHPRSVVSREFDLKLLTDFHEKLALLENAGVKNVLIIDFTPEFSCLTVEEFVLGMLARKIGLKKLVIGHDHRLGKNRGGDENTLNDLAPKNGFEVVPVEPVRLDGVLISSTKIRHCLEHGNVELAGLYLGRPYAVSGLVEQGARRGRTLGFPTANIAVTDSNKLIPGGGVYLCEVSLLSGNYYGVLNIGRRPTFNDVLKDVIEVNILDFTGDIYGQNIEVKFIKKLRNERRFSSAQELVRQVEEDKALAKKWIEEK